MRPPASAHSLYFCTESAVHVSGEPAKADRWRRTEEARGCNEADLGVSQRSRIVDKLIVERIGRDVLSGSLMLRGYVGISWMAANVSYARISFHSADGSANAPGIVLSSIM